MHGNTAGARWRAGLLLAALAAIAVPFFAASCAKPRHTLHRVAIRSFQFEPATLTIAPGDTVEWSNQDIVPHTATSSSWDSGSILMDGSWRWVAQGSGSNAYQCTFHPTMKATLVIR